MTFPITDEQVKRMKREIERRFGMTVSAREACDTLIAALDRRKGERDRRKVRDHEAATKRMGIRSQLCGRRKDDAYDWTNLPLAEPPIQVSEGMREAGRQQIAEFMESTDPYAEGAVAIYRAMEAKRLEEQKAQGAPYGAGFIYRTLPHGVLCVPNERSGHDRRKGGK
jgi:hypothetical protein